ncbi:MAG: undecaprenyl/decaprenyl-phosphate alpha-N-acetylglucosaminyl 1-phosphate transferase [Verrucomicrobiae bacterium]|nr:undecaprenyl/decaprenyl-phosphate alpha-N-acetylglucosaminyl 1-phosphate transferase [Verrucomicrobiae bacterium]
MITQALLAFVIAAIVALIATPAAMSASRRLGFMDEPGSRKSHAGPMPLLGGVAVFMAVVLGALGTGWPTTAADSHRLLGVLGGGALALVLGLTDDRRDLRAGPKLAGQILIAVVAAAGGLRVTLFIPVPALQWLLTVLWLATVMNALNFLDNMDGLCAGVGAICALIFGGIALAHQQTLAATLAAATAGALAGFLPWNFPRAKIFLGDSGSHFTGFMLGALAMLPDYYVHQQPSPTQLPVLIPVIVLALPLFDLVAVMWSRWRRGAPIHIGDANHLSHRLVQLGLSRFGAVLVLHTLTLVLSLGAVELLWAPRWAAVLVIAQTAGVLAIVMALQYYGAKRQADLGGERNTRLDQPGYHR